MQHLYRTSLDPGAARGAVQHALQDRGVKAAAFGKSSVRGETGGRWWRRTVTITVQGSLMGSLLTIEGRGDAFTAAKAAAETLPPQVGGWTVDRGEETLDEYRKRTDG